MIRKLIPLCSRILPPSVWRRIEFAAAYFQGKGSGSSHSVVDEVRAAVSVSEGKDLVIIDAGANKGDWTAAFLEACPKRVKKIFLFEPVPKNVKILEKKFSSAETAVIPFALGDVSQSRVLYSDTAGSGMGSLYDRKLEHFGVRFEAQETINVMTLDEFFKKEHISHIDFLKMDIEGHEMAALRGAEALLRAGNVAALSFEFGGCNIDSRTFFQDFWYFLTPLGYEISRILPGGGLLKIGRYDEMLECFRTTNYIAVLKRSSHVN
jgi:FkbM family methyltransferase